MVKVGDKISAILELHDLRDAEGKFLHQKTGKVVYVHPAGRWCRATFPLGGGRFHEETFQLVDGKPIAGEAEIIGH